MNLFYETRGKGEPIILIPGFASGAWIWNWQKDDLARDFQVITFDPRGIGKSVAEREEDLQDLSIQTFAQDVLQIFDDLKLEKVNVLGASFGGFVAQEFALSFPQRLNKLILACTSFGGPNHVAPETEVLKAFVSTEGMNTSKRIRNFMAPAFTDEYNLKHADVIESVCQMREKSIVPETVYTAQLIVATNFNFEDRVGEIENKTLILTGDKDRIVPMQNSKNLAEQIPNSKLEIIEDGSHMFFVEKAEDFNRAVKNFLEN